MEDADTKFGTRYGSPQKVFRFFKEEWQADSLLRGEIWISTLDKCREYEDSEQGDPNEGIQTHLTSLTGGGGQAGEFKIQELIRRQGIIVDDPESTIFLSGNQHTQRFENSFVLCTSTVDTPEVRNVFGNFGVQIIDTHLFNSILSFALFDALGIYQGIAASVLYAHQSYMDLEPIPQTEIFLIKAPRYDYQKEFRFVWRANKPKIEPFLFKCPAVARLCRRVG